MHCVVKPKRLSATIKKEKRRLSTRGKKRKEKKKRRVEKKDKKTTPSQTGCKKNKSKTETRKLSVTIRKETEKKIMVAGTLTAGEVEVLCY